MRKALLFAVIGLIVLFGLFQLIPYGHNHADPAVAAEPQWDSPQTRELAVRACYDCHSNETAWPWYTNIAPASWLIQHDVEDGRRRLNFSDWSRPQREARSAARQVTRGEMPPWYYLPLHPSARLTPAETQALVDGLQVTLGGR
jgi:mono/diheme cytochrome c family protein